MKKWIIRLIVAGVLLFGVLELILWTVAPVGLHVPVSLRLENKIPGFSETSRIAIDSDGVRSFGYRDAATKILCLGGDNTIAVLQSTADTWWAQMGKEIKESGKDAGVAAWGVPGGSSVLSSRYLVGSIDSLEPDVVILVVAPAELVMYDQLDEFSEDIVKKPLQLGPGGWKQTVIGFSQVARRLRNLFRGDDGGFLRELQGTNKVADEIARQHRNYRGSALSIELIGGFDAQVPATASIMEMAKLCKEHGSRFIVVAEPYPQTGVLTASEQEGYVTYQVGRNEKGEVMPVRIDPSQLKTFYSEFFAGIAKTCEGLGVPFVNHQDQLEPVSALFYGDRYFNDEGHRVFAKVVAGELTEELP